MKSYFNLIKPRFEPVLDPGFRPPVLANRAFLAEVDASGAAVPLVIAVERDQGRVDRYDTRVFAMSHPRAAANFFYVERLLKFLLWQWGGWRAWIGGPRAIGAHIRDTYSPGGARAFDHQFMGEDVYEHTFTVIPCDPAEVPAARESGPASASTSARATSRSPPSRRAR